MRHKGFSLMEMIVVLPLVATLAVALAGVFSPVVRELPKTQSAINTHATLAPILRRIAADVDAAPSLPDRVGELSAGERVLLIGRAGGAVAYRIADGRLIRQELTTTGDVQGKPAHWPIPQVVMRFGLLEHRGRTDAVEIRTAVTYTLRGRTLEKLANSHVYFLNAIGRGRKGS